MWLWAHLNCFLGVACFFDSFFFVMCVCLMSVVCAVLIEPVIFMSSSPGPTVASSLGDGAIIWVRSTASAFFLIWLSFQLGWSFLILVVVLIAAVSLG
jgi:hypothetical protein